MKNRISSAFKHFALSVTLRGLSQRQRKAAFSAPEPRQQQSKLPNEITDDAWMFDRAAVSAVEHRADMMANEMERLADTLSGLRAFLGNVAVDAPLAERRATPNTAPMITDRDLFEGEALTAAPNAIAAAGQLDYIFDEEVVVEGRIVPQEHQARAA